MRCLPFFFFNDTATTEIYTLSLHDALPISSFAPTTGMLFSAWQATVQTLQPMRASRSMTIAQACSPRGTSGRSEEHTSELQSQSNLVCRLLLEKKKKTNINTNPQSRDSHAH